MDIVREIQNEIINSFILDFSKHALNSDIPKISLIWDSIPSQLGRENNKFMFSAIKKSARGREYENSIRLDYLKQLNERYEAWLKSYSLGKLLVINVDDLDFTTNPEDLSLIIDKIDAQIHGLF